MGDLVMKSSRRIFETYEFTIVISNEERRTLMNSVAFYLDSSSDGYPLDAKLLQELFEGLKFDNIGEL